MNQETLLSDVELLILLKEEGQIAFGIIYRKYASELYRYAAKNISRKEDCEEIIQEVFESLWARRESLRIISLRHYLYNAVRYKVIRYFQHNTVRKKYADHFRFFSDLYDNIEKEELDPAELIAKIEQSIDQLPERCQVAFRLRLHENLTNSEIAERMNITKKTVEVYMFKAFQHFRGEYGRLFGT
jgi:RNA polymerase sigma-70 factor (family 1)